MKVDFDFKTEKTIEVILYIIQKMGEKNILIKKLLRLIYLADITHLEMWGRTITGDHYMSDKDGNFPAGTTLMIYSYKTIEPVAFEVDENFRDYLIALRKPDILHMSESDIECIDNTLNNYGKLPNWHLRKLSQDAAWEKTVNSDDIYIDFEHIVDMFDDSRELKDYLLHGND